jgi:hypothetical protein
MQLFFIQLFNRLLPPVLVALPFIGFGFLYWLSAKGHLVVPAGSWRETAIRVIRILGAVGLLLTPFFIGAGIMGLAAEERKGPVFFSLHKAFYISTMSYPLLYLVCTMLSINLAVRNFTVFAFLAQAAPIAIPIVLGVVCFRIYKKNRHKT